MAKMVRVSAKPNAQQYIGGVPVVVELPDGSLQGSGSIIACAGASMVRPQDCAPAMRAILFGQRAAIRDTP